MDIRVTSEYKQINGALIQSRSFLSRRSGARRWPPTELLISFRIPVQRPRSRRPVFFKDVGLIPCSMVCCKCGSQMFWCVDINRKEGYRWRCQRITSASACSATSIRHGSWLRQGNLKFLGVSFLTYIVRRVHAHTMQQEHYVGSAALTEWGNLCRENMLDYALGNHGLKRYIFPPSQSCCCETGSHPTPHTCSVVAHSMSACGVHINTDDVAHSFVVFSRHKRLNLRTIVPHPEVFSVVCHCFQT